MSKIDSPSPPLAGANWIRRLEIADLEQTHRLAAALARVLTCGDLLVLTGGLGAGKTTFTQALGEELVVAGRISSPTFVLSRIHRSAGGGPALVHVDAYRTDAEGLESLDLLATVPEAVTVVEWGRGLVEEALTGPGGSWLDLELAAQHLSAASVSDSAKLGPLGPIVTDFSETAEDQLGAARTAVLRGYGPRWAEPPV